MPPPPPPGGTPAFSDGYALDIPWPPSARYPRSTNAGPLVSTPGSHYRLRGQYAMPNFLSSLTVQNPGYGPAHTRYEEMRHYFQERAYANHGCELVVVKVTMMLQEPGRIKSVIVSVRID